MQPLVDADVLVYEIGFASETGWKAVKEWKEGDAPLDPPPFDYVAELLDNRIADICGTVMATEPPILYLTGAGNFRENIGITLPYKGNRDNLKKPWHYQNIKAYMMTRYHTLVIDGKEADDAMCIVQTQRLKDLSGSQYYLPETIICTRDKDLRQCPGWHFGWELGNQPQFGPEFVEGYGYIKLNDKRNKIVGVGEKFFYSQLITGDKVDNIPGLPSSGPVAAFELLESTTTPEEGFKCVVEAYRAKFPETWKEYLLEQGQLLWMVRELDEEGKPIMWRMPDVQN